MAEILFNSFDVLISSIHTKMPNTRSAPNLNILPQRVVGINGIKSGVKNLPADLLPRKEQKNRMPYLSAPRVLSKAEKWATDWLSRTKELENLDAYNERIQVALNIPNNSPPPRPLDVKVVNLDEIKNQTVHIINDQVAPQPPPDPQPPARPRGGGGGGGGDLAQMNPVTRELSTTSTQTMRDTANAATSTVHLTTGMSTQTEEPESPDPNMALDPPLQHIVQNYSNYHTVNNFLQNHMHNAFHNNLTMNNYHQVVQNTQTTQNVVNQTLHQQNVLNMLNLQQQYHHPAQGTSDNVLQQNAIEGPLERHAVTMPNRLMIQAPTNAAVDAPRRPSVHIPVPEQAPRRGSLPAYGDIDMDFGVVEPPAYQPRQQNRRRLVDIVVPQAPQPPPYPVMANLNRNRARVPANRRAQGTRIIQHPERRTRGVPLPGSNNTVQLPDFGNLPRPEGWSTYMRSARGSYEGRRRDPGWFDQGLDDVPKPGTKRKGGAVRLEPPLKRRLIS